MTCGSTDPCLWFRASCFEYGKCWKHHAMVGRDYACASWEQKVIVVRRQAVTTDRDDPRPAVPARE
jgi:hypothetical protein